LCIATNEFAAGLRPCGTDECVRRNVRDYEGKSIG